MARRGGFKGGSGGILVGLIVTIFLIYLGMSFVSTFSSTMGNLTYTGGGIGDTFFTLAQTWILPLALVGMVIYGVKKFLGGR